jgi:hypothetical protein
MMRLSVSSRQQPEVTSVVPFKNKNIINSNSPSGSPAFYTKRVRSEKKFKIKVEKLKLKKKSSCFIFANLRGFFRIILLFDDRSFFLYYT